MFCLYLSVCRAECVYSKHTHTHTHTHVDILVSNPLVTRSSLYLNIVLQGDANLTEQETESRNKHSHWNLVFYNSNPQLKCFFMRTKAASAGGRGLTSLSLWPVAPVWRGLRRPRQTCLPRQSRSVCVCVCVWGGGGFCRRALEHRYAGSK